MLKSREMAFEELKILKFSRGTKSISERPYYEVLFPQHSEFDCGNIFASREAKFCFRDDISRGGETGINRKHNVSAAMFPSLP